MLREVIAATLIMATATATAYAGGERIRGQRRHGGPRAGAALRQLDLSDSQREAIRQLMEREREATRGLREEIRAKATELRELRQTDDPRAESLRTEIRSIHEQFRARREAMKAEIDRILTPEQRQRLEEMKSQRRCQ